MKKYPVDKAGTFPGREGGLSGTQLKALRALKARKGRDEQGRFLIEGVHLCAEALGSDRLPVLLLYTPSGFRTREIKETVIRAQQKGVSNLKISESTLKSLADAATPQGIIAVMSKRIPESVPGQGHMFILLDQVRDPGNAGTIIRTADAVGADGIYLTAGSVELYNSKVLRSTQGSIFHLPVTAGIDPATFLDALKSRGWRVFVARPRAAKTHTEVRYPGRFVLAVGNETRGVSREVGDRADQFIRVPILGRAESLNVAMACGVILYEALRQRGKRRAPGIEQKKRRRP